jgi:hypothetical protein
MNFLIYNLHKFRNCFAKTYNNNNNNALLSSSQTKTKTKTTESSSVCIICLDSSFAYTQQVLLKKMNYDRKCDCNCVVHSKCLNQWITTNNSCPICHKTIVKFVPTKINVRKFFRICKEVLSICYRIVRIFAMLNIAIHFIIMLLATIHMIC